MLPPAVDHCLTPFLGGRPPFFPFSRAISRIFWNSIMPSEHWNVLIQTKEGRNSRNMLGDSYWWPCTKQHSEFHSKQYRWMNTITSPPSRLNGSIKQCAF